MKTRKVILLLLLSLLLFSGCNIQIRTIIPDEHGTVFDWFKKEEDKTETSQEKEPAETTPVEVKTEPNVPAEETKQDSPKKDNPVKSEGESKNSQDEKDSGSKNEDTNVKASVLKVSISPEKPSKDGYITLNVEGPANTPYSATFYFRTRESIIQGYCGSPFEILLGGATVGYEVKVEVTALIDGKVQKAKSSFTPQ